MEKSNIVEDDGSSPSSLPLLPCVVHAHKTGTFWTAFAHIITAVIGTGVLSLAWSMSQLGWIAGPLTMLAFASVTLVSMSLLSHCYTSPDPSGGFYRNASYMDAVRRILGKKNTVFCGIIVHIYYIKIGIVYTITSSISLSAVQRSNCYHYEGHTAACQYQDAYCILIFGIIQVVLSQIPDFQSTEWLSIIAATMSFGYSFIGSGLGLAKVIENGEIKGSIGGVPASTAIDKVWSVSQAIGDVAFAFPCSLLFMEIMDTLKSNPPEETTMKKASITSVCITTFFFLCCGGFGYAAFGNSTPGDLLTGFGFYEPFWLVDLANIFVVVHLVGAYQVYSQPLYASMEQWVGTKFPDSGLLNDGFRLRVFLRTAYVAFTTGFAFMFPYFNQVVGLAGSITFWPVIVYFPVEMYLARKDIRPWAWTALLLRGFSFIILAVIIFAFVGSIKGLIIIS